MSIKTDEFSRKLREKVLKAGSKEILISKIAGSSQEKDLSKPVNCNGYGRIRHFQRARNPRWANDPLPMDPASKRLNIKLDLFLDYANISSN